MNERWSTAYLYQFAFFGGFQRMDRLSGNPEDAQHFEPEQKLLLQKSA